MKETFGLSSKSWRLADNEIFLLSPISGFPPLHWSQDISKWGIQEPWSCESSYDRPYFWSRDTIAQLKLIVLGITVPFQARLCSSSSILCDTHTHPRDLEQSSSSAEHMLFVGAVLNKSICTNTLSRGIRVLHRCCHHCAAAANLVLFPSGF